MTTHASYNGATLDDDAEHVDSFDSAVSYRMTVLRVMREAKRRLDAEEHTPPELPAVTGLDTLLAEPDPPTAYRVEHLAPAGSRVMLAAQYKAGKTTIVDNLARALVDGDPFLGRFDVRTPARRLVLIDNEVSRRQRRRWLAEQKIGNTAAVADVVSLRGKVSTFDLLDPRCLADWVARLSGIGCDYLVLDCLRPVLDVLGLDENRDAGRFLVRFDELLDRAGIPDAVVVDHMGHGAERARGDSRKLDWPDAIWRLVRENDDPHSPRYFSAYGRDVDVHEGRLSFSNRRLTYAAGSRSDAKAEAALSAVIDVLAADKSGGLSGRAIEAELSGDHSQAAIRKAMRLAVDRALLTTTAGQRGAKLHSIAMPCRRCGKPLTAGQDGVHKSCATAGDDGWLQ